MTDRPPPTDRMSLYDRARHGNPTTREYVGSLTVYTYPDDVPAAHRRPSYLRLRHGQRSHVAHWTHRLDRIYSVPSHTAYLQAVEAWRALHAAIDRARHVTPAPRPAPSYTYPVGHRNPPMPQRPTDPVTVTATRSVCPVTILARREAGYYTAAYPDRAQMPAGTVDPVHEAARSERFTWTLGTALRVALRWAYPWLGPVLRDALDADPDERGYAIHDGRHGAGCPRCARVIAGSRLGNPARYSKPIR